VTQTKRQAVLNTKKAVFNKSHGSSYLSQSFILTKLKKRLRTVIEQNKVLAFVLAEAKNQNRRLKTAAIRQEKIERLLLPQLKGWMEESLGHMQDIARVHTRAVLYIHNILMHGHDVTLAPDCGDVLQEAPSPRRRSLHPPGSRLTGDLTVVEEDPTGEQESISPGQPNPPAQNGDKLLLPDVLATPSNDGCQSFLHAPSPGRSDEHAGMEDAPGQQDMRLSTSPCTEGSGFLLYEHLERQRRSSETLSASLPASPFSPAGSDVHFAFSPLTSQQPEPAVWKSPSSSNTTPLADIAFVCYEDLSGLEEVKSPGVVAVAKDSLSVQQASPKTSHKLPAETKNPRYKFFTSKNAHADGTAGASKKTTVSPRQPPTDKADPAPEASPSGRVSTSRTSQRIKTPFFLQSRTGTSSHEKSIEEPDEATADDPPPPSRRSGRTRKLSLPSYKEPSVNR
ncbi:unnamed protein product, partial [Ixodes pacificus]